VVVIKTRSTLSVIKIKPFENVSPPIWGAAHFQASAKAFFIKSLTEVF
jgi:hypothetical protein